MQVAKIVVRGAKAEDQLRFSSKELLILSELGLDQVPSATGFVEFVSGSYGISASGVWYTLKKLKKKRVVDFMEKGEGYKPLALTEYGLNVFRKQQAQWPEYNGYVPIGRAASSRFSLQ